MLYTTRHFQASACMAKCTHTKRPTYHHFQRHAELDSGQGRLRCHPSKKKYLRWIQNKGYSSVSPVLPQYETAEFKSRKSKWNKHVTMVHTWAAGYQRGEGNG